MHDRDVRSLTQCSSGTVSAFGVLPLPLLAPEAAAADGAEGEQPPDEQGWRHVALALQEGRAGRLAHAVERTLGEAARREDQRQAAQHPEDSQAGDAEVEAAVESALAARRSLRGMGAAAGAADAVQHQGSERRQEGQQRQQQTQPGMGQLQQVQPGSEQQQQVQPSSVQEQQQAEHLERQDVQQKQQQESLQQAEQQQQRQAAAMESSVRLRTPAAAHVVIEVPTVADNQQTLGREEGQHAPAGAAEADAAMPDPLHHTDSSPPFRDGSLTLHLSYRPLQLPASSLLTAEQAAAAARSLAATRGLAAARTFIRLLSWKAPSAADVSGGPVAGDGERGAGDVEEARFRRWMPRGAAPKSGDELPDALREGLLLEVPLAPLPLHLHSYGHGGEMPASIRKGVWQLLALAGPAASLPAAVAASVHPLFYLPYKRKPSLQALGHRSGSDASPVPAGWRLSLPLPACKPVPLPRPPPLQPSWAPR